jgi:hypothetical protein
VQEKNTPIVIGCQAAGALMICDTHA